MRACVRACACACPLFLQRGASSGRLAPGTRRVRCRRAVPRKFAGRRIPGSARASGGAGMAQMTVTESDTDRRAIITLRLLALRCGLKPHPFGPPCRVCSPSYPSAAPPRTNHVPSSLRPCSFVAPAVIGRETRDS